MSAQTEKFQVDLSGMVDLLSRHLYSGPQVYVRELLQNGVDAITAAKALNPDNPEKVWLRVLPAESTLEVYDSGIGLSAAQATELLATIGKSSKRDSELGFGRAEFLGQFGIGLLATFMVADTITVISQSRVANANGQLPNPISWVGHANGTFTVAEIAREDVPELIRDGGSLVRLSARKDSKQLVYPQTVSQLAKNYGELLPLQVMFAVVTETGEPQWQRLTRPAVPWQESYISEQLKTAALESYAEDVFNFTPLATIDLEVPALGITGVAYVLPQAVSPGSGKHRVYLKRMLLGDSIDNVLPEWAFFVRAVIDTDSLSPTASREQLHNDSRLELARETIGNTLKQWIRSYIAEPNTEALHFLETHNLALRAVAVEDNEMLELIAETLPYETTEGTLTLKEASGDGELLYTTTVKEFKRAQAVARAAGLTLVNGGYAYDAALIKKLQSQLGWRVREMQPDDLSAALKTPDVEREMATAAALSYGRQVLDAANCDLILRAFEPATLPAMLLLDRESEFQDQLRATQAESPDLWDGLLDAFTAADSGKSRKLVLNDNAEVVHTLLQSDFDDVFEAGLMSLYISAIAHAGEGLKGSETALLSEGLNVLLQAALHRK